MICSFERFELMSNQKILEVIRKPYLNAHLIAPVPANTMRNLLYMKHTWVGLKSGILHVSRRKRESSATIPRQNN